MLGRHPTRMIW